MGIAGGCRLAVGFSSGEKAFAQISFLVMGVAGTAGIVMADWPWVLPYLAIFWYGVPGIVMRRLVCPRCPHLHDFGDCLQAPVKVTRWLCGPKKTGPLSKVERVVFLGIFFLIPTYPIFWLLSNVVLLAAFLTGAFMWYSGQFLYFCRRCRVHACPFNRVPVASPAMDSQRRRLSSFRLWLLLVGVLVLTGSCQSRDRVLPTEPEPGQYVLFHVYNQNFAWGFWSGGGIVITSDGTVWELTSGVSWGAEVEALFEGEIPDFTYPQGEIEELYGAGMGSILMSLPATEVRQHFGLVGAVAASGYSPPENTGADIGMTVAGALLLDPEAEEYRKVVISVTGDRTITSLSTRAKKLDDWLRGVFVQAITGR